MQQPSIQVEFSRLLRVKTQVNDIWRRVQYTDKRASRYEFDNIIERLLINSINGKSEAAVDKAMLEMKEKKIQMRRVDIDGLQRMLIEDPTKVMSVEIKNTKDSYTCRTQTGHEFIFTFRARDDKLRQFTPEDVLLSAIKYEQLLPRGQQWSIPYQQYIKLFTLGFRYEAFASPFNSNMLRLNGKYCSIFEEDKKLGSLGSFFDVEITPGQKWVVNPPFTEDLLLRAAKKCVENISTCSFFFIMAAWTDCDAYILLKQHASETITLPKNTYFYETGAGKHITGTFNSVVFLLGDFPKNKNILREMTSRFPQ